MSSFFSKIKTALSKTSNKISTGIEHIFIKRKLDDQALEQLEEILLLADVGLSETTNILSTLKKNKYNSDISADEVKLELANIIQQRLQVNENKQLIPENSEKNNLQIVVVCGVNGNGKTTTIGKLAKLYKDQGKKVAVAACDTFRAAATSQLKEWADASSVRFFEGHDKEDPASVAHKAVATAISEQFEIIFIDTAGRLQNQTNLMSELGKINRVITKLVNHEPQQTILVIDGSTGQNALSQVENFRKTINLTGLIVTKLDGTAKAGALISCSNKYDLPIYYVGIGEKAEDIKPFDSSTFAKAIVGLEEIVK